MKETFYLLVTVQLLDQNGTIIEGSMNYNAGAKVELEKLRDILYAKMLDKMEYFVLYDMTTNKETWVPGTLLKNSIVSFLLVDRPSLCRT